MAVKKSIEITPYDTPWEIACKMINTEYDYTNILGKEQIVPMLDKDRLYKIGMHLINYCKTEMEADE